MGSCSSQRCLLITSSSIHLSSTTRPTIKIRALLAFNCNSSTLSVRIRINSNTSRTLNRGIVILASVRADLWATFKPIICHSIRVMSCIINGKAYRIRLLKDMEVIMEVIIQISLRDLNCASSFIHKLNQSLFKVKCSFSQDLKVKEYRFLGSLYQHFTMPLISSP